MPTSSDEKCDFAFEFLRSMHPEIRVVLRVDCPRWKGIIQRIIGGLIVQSF